jgi:hypothetical protein
MNNARLLITDGTKSISLLNLRSWLLQDWSPSIPEPKGGGVFRSSPLTDGRNLASKRLDNVIETFNLVGSGANQDNLIYEIQELERLLEKAVNYWITDWQNEPVWLEARASCEDEIRYSVITDYRLTGFGSPFKQPFFNAYNMTATEAILAVEHSSWQSTIPCEEGTCVQISSTRHYPEMGAVTSATFEPAQSSDDVEIDLLNHKVHLDHTTDYIGTKPTEEFCETAILFDNITIPHGAYIVSAYIQLEGGAHSGASAMGVKIYFQDPDKGAVITFSGTWWDYSTRKRIPGYVGWKAPHFDIGTTYNTPSLISMIQHVVDSTSWASGQDMVVFLEYESVTPPADFRGYYTFDSVHEPPKLIVEWLTTEGTEIGRTATCLNEVFVANKHNVAPITHVYYKDVSDGVTPWHGNFIGDPTYPYGILPAAPAVGDFLYFGSSTAVTNSGPFNTIVFDLHAAQTGITDIHWSYYNGATYTLFVPGSTMCGNWLLDEAGVTSITFRQPENWVAETVNGVAGYWITAEIITVPGASTPPEQQNRDIYTVVQPFVDIDEAQVKGDIPALARIIFDSNACYPRPTATLSMGLRSLERGEDFTAYLNCSEEQNQVGITFGITEGTVNLTTATESPSGHNIDCSGFSNTALTYLCHWEFDPSVSGQYPGVYHAYVRCRQTSGTVQAVKFRLRSVFGTGYNVTYSETNVTYKLNEIIAVDLGQINIQSPRLMLANGGGPTTKKPTGYQPTSMRIILDASNLLGDDFEVYDVVLLPTDEWVGTFAGTPEGVDETIAYEGKRIDVDGITNPRMYRALLNEIISTTSQTIDAELFRIASSRPILQSNKNQRLWFLQTHDIYLYSYFEATGKVRLQRSDRYLVMRGNR